VIVVSVKAPPPPAKCLCRVAWEIRPQVTVPEVQVVAGSTTVQATAPENQQTAWDVRVQATTPEVQTANDIRLVLEYSIS